MKAINDIFISAIFHYIARKDVMKGSVKMFNKEKGFGFIRAEDNQDYFFHYSSIISEERYKSLDQGDNVEFEVDENNARGLRAKDVKKVQ